MIYGIVPIGGKGTRLGLPFDKEMLPQKNYNHYNPVVNHVVGKMLLAGVEVVVFVHGTEFKQSVQQYYNDSQYKHIKQNTVGFANVLRDFRQQFELNSKDKVVFGLPDSVFEQNLFEPMLEIEGIVCGLFVTTAQTAVDRLINHSQQFDVKSSKTVDNLDWFWGVLKFDIENIDQMIQDQMFDQYKEIGHILNHYECTMVYGKNYWDLGTWPDYNRYLAWSGNI